MAMKKMNESYQTISSVSTVSTASVAPSSSAVFPRNGDTISMNVISTLSTQFHTKHDIENAFESTCIICLGHFSRFNPPFHIPCQGTCRFASEYVHGECIHQWKITKENRDEAPSCPLCRDDLCSFNIVHLGQPPSSRVLEIDAIARRKFITSPLLKSFGVVRCYIRVKKQSRCSFIKHKSIELFYQTSEYKDGTYLPKVDYPKRSDSFLLFAENKGLINDSYSISCDIERKDVDHHNVLGTLNSNIRRNEYTLTSPLEGKREMELAGISINRSQCGKGSSSKTIQMNVCTPGIAECNEEDDDVKFNFCEDGENDKEDKDFYAHWKILDMPKGQSEQSLLQRAKQLNKEREIVQTSKITKLSVNEQPRWNDDLQAYSMDFDGRYMLPSRKNFKLISSTSSTLDKSRVEIQFGKILKSDNTSVYAMDVQWPMSLLQAFSICLTRL